MAPTLAPAAAWTAPAVFKNIMRVVAILFGAFVAFDIRMIAIREYGRIIHECEPWRLPRTRVEGGSHAPFFPSR